MHEGERVRKRVSEREKETEQARNGGREIGRARESGRVQLRWDCLQ